MTLATNLGDPADPNSLQRAPAGNGTLKVDQMDRLPDGTLVMHYSFSFANGQGGTIIGSGVGTWP